MEKRYAWDNLGTQADSNRRCVIAEHISLMITRGFEVRDMKLKLMQLKSLK